MVVAELAAVVFTFDILERVAHQGLILQHKIDHGAATPMRVAEAHAQGK
jgi:hypothetical protein